MNYSDSFPQKGFFEAVYDGEAPWDIGAPQPDLVEFRVGDALRASAVAGEVESVVDSGFFHLFATRLALSRELAAALPRGGKYYMLGFAIAIPAPNVPRQVTEAEIADVFSHGSGWNVEVMRPARFRTRGLDDIPALAVCAERMSGPEWG